VLNNIYIDIYIRRISLLKRQKFKTETTVSRNKILSVMPEHCIAGEMEL